MSSFQSCSKTNVSIAIYISVVSTCQLQKEKKQLLEVAMKRIEKPHSENVRSYLPELWRQLESVTHIIEAVAQVRGVHSYKYCLVTHLLSSLH